jgi:hypothetical protein
MRNNYELNIRITNVQSLKPRSLLQKSFTSFKIDRSNTLFQLKIVQLIDLEFIYDHLGQFLTPFVSVKCFKVLKLKYCRHSL